MKNTFIIFLLFLGLQSNGQTTWSNEIACFVYNNCVSCHNPNGIAPFSMLTYQDTYDHRFAISSSVQGGTMPPNPADLTNVNYLNHKELSEQEIQTFIDWVENGAPSGDLDSAPTMPVIENNEVITDPDFVIQIPTSTSQADEEDDYRCFAFTSSFPDDKFITALEVIPGNPNIVHHVLVYASISDDVLQLDENDPDPGYVCFGGIGSSSTILLGGWVPGQSPYMLPNNMGIKLPAGANLVIQLHYPEGSLGQIDSTKVNFQFSDTPANIREAAMTPILDHFSAITDGPLYVPANTIQTFHEERDIPIPITVLGVLPHMHLIGTSIKTWVETPSNTILPIVDIPEWDFEYQFNYAFKQPVIVPAGSTFKSEAVYDNTNNNPNNPSTPPQDVSAGEATTDEMMITFITWTVYQPGDENLNFTDDPPLSVDCAISSIDPTLLSDYFDVFPNPVNKTLHLKIKSTFRGQYSLTNVMGQNILSGNINNTNQSINVKHIPSGLYFINIFNNTTRLSQKIIIR